MAIGSRRRSPILPAAAAVFSDAMMEPRNVPCCQDRASVTSGTIGGAAAAEQDGADRNALGVLPLLGDHRALLGRGREARVGMGCRTASGRGPGSAQPVDGLGRGPSPICSHQTSPSGVSATLVKMQSSAQRAHRVGVALVGRAGGDAEEAGLGVDGVEPAIGAELHPADVVADRLGLPAGDRGHEHGEVGLAAGRREGGRRRTSPRPGDW